MASTSTRGRLRSPNDLLEELTEGAEPIVEESALSSLQFHFHRKKHRTCSEGEPHNIMIHVALDNDASRNNLEASMLEAGMEQAAERIDVFSIDRSQFYTPLLGTYPKSSDSPDLTWDRGRLTPFSYLQVKKTMRGIMKLQKFPSPSSMDYL